MPDIGMVDLITPIQAGANIVAQANNIRRQREQMVLQRIQSQQRGEELKQLGIVRQNEAQKAQYELQTEKEKKAARMLFGEAYNKAYSEFVKTKPDSTESERAEFALRTALPQAHPDDIPDIVKSVSASAIGQDKNKVAMDRAILQFENQAKLNEIRLQNSDTRIHYLEEKLAQGWRSIQDKETLNDAIMSLRQQQAELKQENSRLGNHLKFITEFMSEGDKAYDSRIKAGGPDALLEANNAKTKARELVQKRWSEESGYRVPQTTTTNTKPTPSPKDAGDEGNVDTEANQDGNEMVIPPTKTKPKTPESKKLKWDDSQGLVPR